MSLRKKEDYYGRLSKKRLNTFSLLIVGGYYLRVLLVDPIRETSYACPSLGLMYIAAVLEEKSIEVEILELRFMKRVWTELKKAISKKNPDIVGATAYTYTFPEAVKVMKIAKHVNPDILTVLGGPHVTFTDNETLTTFPQVDVVVRGEGEYTMLELLKAYNKKNDFKKVKGISFRKNKKIVKTASRPLITNLDVLPFPARHLVSMSRYREIENSTTMISSRGCPFNCIFCSSRAMWGSKIRMRSPKNVIDEMEQLVEEYHFNIINFADDVFTYDKKRTIKMCEEIKKRGVDVAWECSTRIDLLSKELLRRMKAAGCTAIFLGIESGCQKVLQRIRKDTRLEQARKVAEWTRELGIKARLSFMLGCPGENLETVQKTLHFAKELGELSGGTIGFSMLKAYPGTELFKNPKKYGITFIDKDWGWKYGVPLFPTCESEELNMLQRYKIALRAAEAEYIWNMKRNRVLEKTFYS